MNVPENVVLQNISCPLGHRNSDEVILTGRDLLHDLPGEFTIVKCRACELMRTNPRPTPGTIGFYYPDNYGPYLGTQVRQTESVSIIKKLLRPLVRRIINSNSTKLPPQAPGRMLEIGCASGSFLHQMAGQGWQVQGIEFSEKAAQAAVKLGYCVHSGALETAPKPEKPFDLIVGWMVLEHLHDPIDSLRKLKEWSQPDAWLALSVPNAASLEFKLFKEHWYALQLPTHLHHFTPESLAKVLNAGGWTLKKVYHQRTLSNLIASTGYVLQNRGYEKLGRRFIEFPEKGGKWTHLVYPLAWLFSIFGQTGRMTIWARVQP